VPGFPVESLTISIKGCSNGLRRDPATKELQ
jgi:hypothetical protein